MPELPELPGTAGVVVLLALMAALAPALGVPSELMLQDTLKSMVVAFGVLAAALLLFHQAGRTAGPLRWHDVLWLPLLLMAWALGSMAWSHAYLAGVEAIRWFLFALLLWLGLNSFGRARLPWLALGIHLGAVAASLWAALQFWADLRLFPQGPNPASTFVNRNFFAEFAVCTLPFSALLLARARRSATVAVLAASSALVVVAILMTGTRAALIALWLQLLLLFPLIGWRWRAALEASRWNRGLALLAVAVFVGGVAGLGAIPSGNAKILDEGRGTTALERGLRRTGSIAPQDASLGLRLQMWKATLGLIADHPLAGVGAGAWEVHIPRYQADGAQLETDYYVHNEPLQLLAEDGLVGAAVLLGLLAYLLAAARRSWRLVRPDGGEEGEEGAWRAAALTSLLALLIVSNVGFPWRMAATGALFALCLAILAASDARLGVRGAGAARPLAWRASWARPALAATVVCLALAASISQQAAECERKIVRATQLALAISAAGDWNSPRWTTARAEVLRLTREAVAINPHYRKITPMVADELARWDDWRNATWIWESVLQSRPDVVAILTNAARGHVVLGQMEQAAQLLERARRISPDAPGVRSLQAILQSRQGRDAEAAQLARAALAQGLADEDMLSTAFVVGWRLGDAALVEQAAAQRARDYPGSAVQVYLQLGNFRAARHDEARALQAWRQALALAGPQGQAAVLAQVPAVWRERLAR